MTDEHPMRAKMLELQAEGTDVATMPLADLAAALDADAVSVVNYHRSVLKSSGKL